MRGILGSEMEEGDAFAIVIRAMKCSTEFNTRDFVTIARYGKSDTFSITLFAIREMSTLAFGPLLPNPMNFVLSALWLVIV